MTRSITTSLCLAAALAASGCSAKPRQFSAQVRPLAETPTTAPLAANERTAFTDCDRLVRSGRKSEFATAAASTGAATAAVLGSGAVVAASGTVGLGGATAAGAAMLTAIPFVGLAAGLGLNRAIRGGRERGYRKHMTTCMGEMGYEVADWTRAPKKQHGTASLVPGSAPATTAVVATAPVTAPVTAISAEPVTSPDPVAPSDDGEAHTVVVQPAPVV